MAWKENTGKPSPKRLTVTIDASGRIVGRLATQIAIVLMGKDKPDYTPHIDSGVYVKILNADQLVYSGKKMDQKVLFTSSNRPSGIKRHPVAKMQEENPGEVLVHAVKYMLPKNRTQKERLKRLLIA